MQTMVSDRRRVARYVVRVPIEVVEVGTGSTLDISAAGISFLIDRMLEPGREIRFELALHESDVRLHCDGRVLRVEKRALGGHVTAATIDNIAMKPATGH